MLKEKILDCITGSSVADALGVPVEFESRKALLQNPVTHMRGYGTYNQPPGTWSDDTSMTLCLLDSLTGGLDERNIMRNFLAWLEEGKYTPYDQVFDVGMATRKAIIRFAQGADPNLCGGRAEHDNGNGSLMRILPLAFYLFAQYGEDFIENAAAIRAIHRVSALTHAHERSQIACGIYLSIAGLLINDMPLDRAIVRGIEKAKRVYEEWTDGVESMDNMKPDGSVESVAYKEELKHYQRIFHEDFKDLPPESIKSSGYVVDTLEAALWCLFTTDSYKSCVLKAVNLGEDTDTVAAVAGGLAGLYYGMKEIPEEWIGQLARFEEIKVLCEVFALSLGGGMI